MSKTGNNDFNQVNSWAKVVIFELKSQKKINFERNCKKKSLLKIDEIAILSILMKHVSSIFSFWKIWGTEWVKNFSLFAPPSWTFTILSNLWKASWLKLKLLQIRSFFYTVVWWSMYKDLKISTLKNVKKHSMYHISFEISFKF